MRLSDIMSAFQLTTYPIVALCIFLLVFSAVMIRVFGRGRAAELQRAAHLPLHDDLSPPVAPTPRAGAER
jgi:cbb3-type cytochrome oxidase subunit 3